MTSYLTYEHARRSAPETSFDALLVLKAVQCPTPCEFCICQFEFRLHISSLHESG